MTLSGGTVESWTLNARQSHRDQHFAKRLLTSYVCSYCASPSWKWSPNVVKLSNVPFYLFCFSVYPWNSVSFRILITSFVLNSQTVLLAICVCLITAYIYVYKLSLDIKVFGTTTLQVCCIFLTCIILLWRRVY